MLLSHYILSYSKGLVGFTSSGKKCFIGFSPRFFGVFNFYISIITYGFSKSSKKIRVKNNRMA
nr:MAG TPA: hypothetical protein [Caudoviricetes sp.]